MMAFLPLHHYTGHHTNMRVLHGMYVNSQAHMASLMSGCTTASVLFTFRIFHITRDEYSDISIKAPKIHSRILIFLVMCQELAGHPVLIMFSLAGTRTLTWLRWGLNPYWQQAPAAHVYCWLQVLYSLSSHLRRRCTGYRCSVRLQRPRH